MTTETTRCTKCRRPLADANTNWLAYSHTQEMFFTLGQGPKEDGQDWHAFCTMCARIEVHEGA